MNLTVVDIVKAHGEKLANAAAKVHERLLCMDQERVIPDEQAFVNSIVGNELINLPISVLEEDVTIGNIAAAVAERLSEAEENYNLVQDGRTYVDEEWVISSCWEMELAERGEDNPVTMGARPVALRTLALLDAERETQDLAGIIVEMKPSPRWAAALSSIEDEAARAQNFIDTVVPNITETEMQDDSTMHQFVTPEPVVGHPRDVMLEFAPGQVICVLTFILSWDDEEQEGEVAIIDDNNLELEKIIPDAILNASVGKPLETIFDHEFVRGLGLIIEKYEVSSSGTRLYFEPTEAIPLTMKDAPANWWQ